MPSSRLANKLLLIGWDAADWKVINPLMDSGKMPALQRLVDRGVIGNLATMDPPLSPMLWTSIATGHTADRHGILGFTQADESGAALSPILGSSRKVKALWNILSQEGLRSNVVSWWPSHPAEPIQGAMVSNFFHRAAGPPWADWPVPGGAVQPEELTDVLRGCRIHPAEVTEALIQPFVPFLSDTGTDDLDDGDTEKVQALARILTDATTTHATTTWLMENTEWDLTAVYLDAIDHACHGFMKYHPPRLPNVSEEGFEKYRHVIESMYRYHDMMLGRLVELAGPDTTVLLISDHGFHSDHLRPAHLPKEPAAPAYEHRQHGVFCLAGPGIQRDSRVYGASLLDIAPTVLTLFGLPIGEDMPGRPLAEAFEKPPEVEQIPSWEQVEGESGQHGETEGDLWAQHAVLQQLIDLGYIEPPEEGKDPVERSRRESQYYLARVYTSTQRTRLAIPILRELVEEAPEEDRYALRLVNALKVLGEYDEAREALDAYEIRLRERMEERNRSDRPIPGLHLHRGSLELSAGNVDAALEHLALASKATPHYPSAHFRIGEAFLHAKRWEEAEAAMNRALAIDPHLAEAHRGVGLAALRMERPEDAADAALRAVSLRYHYPAAHYVLGEALVELGYFERAAEAFEVSLLQEPGLRRAHVWLSELYRVRLNEPAKAAHHLQMAVPEA